MSGIEHIPSTAYWAEPNPEPRLGVINHVMQGFQSTMIAWAEQRPYTTPKSATFTIGRQGRIVQHVSAWDHSWAAGGVCSPTWALLPANTNPNRVAINIEWEGFSVDPLSYSYDHLYGEGVDAKGRPMRPWPKAQVDAAVRVHRWLFENGIVAGEPNGNTITGHFATDACSRALDPGPFWLETVRPVIIDALTGPVFVDPPPDELPGTGLRLTKLETDVKALQSLAHTQGHEHGGVVPG
jgi:N-acetyl-anhydromuramyl-L-alanine amidase AmpD